jgi:hypothetical protein
MASGYSESRRRSQNYNNNHTEEEEGALRRKSTRTSRGSPRSPRPSRKSTRNMAGTPPRGNRTRRNTGVPETTTPLPSLVYKGLPADWWHRFSIKITNLITLLNSLEDKLNYVITGSSAVALLTYHYRPDLLNRLQAPNDCDILIYADNKGFKKLSFSSLSITKIGNYKLKKDQLDTKSGTFIKDTESENTFPNIDISIETGGLNYVELPELPEFRILDPEKLLKDYKGYLGSPGRENKINNNKNKISFLDKVLIEYVKSQLVLKHFSKNISARRREELGEPVRLFN